MTAASDVTLGTGVGVRPLSDAPPDLSDLNAFETIAATPAPRPAPGTGRSSGILAPPRVGTDSSASGGMPPPPTGTGTGQMSMIGPGQTIGTRYHVIRLLGIGGMGAVYHAWDAELGVAVALKVIRTDVSGDPDATAAIERQFKQELLLARQVTHKHVVRIHDLGDIDGVKYITMPYVQGADLATVLKQAGKLPIPRTLKYLRQIVDGLVAAHDAGVVHRDLKPANIMIDEEDSALIMDFGIARSSANTHSGVSQVVGTLAYMAPEQAQAKTTDQRADVYALGMMAREMLVGRTGGDGQQALADLMQRIKEAPPRIATIDPLIPEPLDALVARCVEPDPADRFQTSAELAAALETLDDDGHLRPTVVPKAPVPWRLIAASGVLVAALLSGTWWYTRTPPPVKPHDPVSVLIADFQNQTSDPTFDHSLESVLKLALEGAGFISAYDRGGMRTLGVRPPETLDERAAQEIAVKQGVNVVVSGSLNRRGDGYEISLTATQAVTGNVITRAKENASDKGRVLGVATKLATAVRKALGDNTSDSAQRFAMDTVTSGSLDAVHEYAVGQQALADNRSADAIRSFAKAAELDSNFAGAYTGLAIASRNIGQQQDAEKYIKEAIRHLDRMTERERYRTRGLSFLITSDYQACVKEHSEMIARYAADAAAHNNLALCVSNLRNMSKAAEEMRQVVKILPKRALYRLNLALYEAYGGNFQGAEPDGRQAQELGSPLGWLSVAFAQLGQNQLAEAADSYQKLAQVNPLSASYAASGLGDLAVYQGRFSDAVRILQEGAAADLQANYSDRAAAKLAALAYTRLLQRQKGAAIAAAESALAHSNTVKIRFLAGRVFVEAGDVARARKLAAGLGSQLQAEPQALAKILEAEAALKTGDRPQALKALTDANALMDTWIGRFDLGRVYLEAGALIEADSEFDRCIKRHGEALSLFLDEEPTVGFLPQVYYYQGRVREALKTDGFVESYRTYLSLREKPAEDPLLPEVRKRAGL
jgi:serine/threonine protein kinase/Flp pilus assembly protein TadD